MKTNFTLKTIRRKLRNSKETTEMRSDHKVYSNLFQIIIAVQFNSFLIHPLSFYYFHNDQICIGYHMRGEVISVLSLEGRYHILSRVSAANEGQNMIS